MLNFFRNIRRRLPTENKSSKYLLHAIGEIALVVIGILIALQIDDWNENRKESALVNTYKKGLIENLIKDSLNINETLLRINSESNAIKEFEQRVSSSSQPFDTILKIARFEYDFKIWINYDYEQDTYQVLNATGYISLFSNDIMKDLNALYNLQERTLFANSQSFETYRNGLAQYAQKYPYSFNSNLIQDGTVAASLVWDNISLSNHATEFNALIVAKGDNYRLALKRLPLIQDKTNELLAKLRNL